MSLEPRLFALPRICIVGSEKNNLNLPKFTAVNRQSGVLKEDTEHR
jgi:hypothetical protein